MQTSGGLLVAGIILVVASAVALLFFSRFELVTITDGGKEYVYRLDTITGEMKFCTGRNCRPVEIQSE